MVLQTQSYGLIILYPEVPVRQNCGFKNKADVEAIREARTHFICFQNLVPHESVWIIREEVVDIGVIMPLSMTAPVCLRVSVSSLSASAASLQHSQT